VPAITPRERTVAEQHTIPTIDLAPLRNGSEAEQHEVARKIDAACTDIGFFLVAGHGIPQQLVEAARQRTIAFFALPEAQKLKVERPPAKISRGYNRIGDRSVAYSMGQPAPPDIQEAFGFGPDRSAELAALVDNTSAQMYAPNLWPEQPHDFKDTLLAYREAMSGLAAQVLRAMALSLGIDESFFADKFDRQASVVRVIRYPAVTAPPLPGQLRAGAHTDYSIMTFVRGDDTPGGLQVKHRQGGWIDVHIPPDAFACNIGDLMMRWSNDRWVSTLHRVAVPPPDAVPSDRISLVFFQYPNPDTVIRCLESCAKPGEEKYPPITVAEHYLGKLMKAGHSRLDATAKDALASREPEAAPAAH
jgi:isopenicillin N synthase-like dioxygenase